jgi:hypothetical protein
MNLIAYQKNVKDAQMKTEQESEYVLSENPEEWSPCYR